MTGSRSDHSTSPESASSVVAGRDRSPGWPGFDRCNDSPRVMPRRAGRGSVARFRQRRVEVAVRFREDDDHRCVVAEADARVRCRSRCCLNQTVGPISVNWSRHACRGALGGAPGTVTFRRSPCSRIGPQRQLNVRSNQAGMDEDSAVSSSGTIGSESRIGRSVSVTALHHLTRQRIELVQVNPATAGPGRLDGQTTSSNPARLRPNQVATRVNRGSTWSSGRACRPGPG
jgi:hypothetical protein